MKFKLPDTLSCKQYRVLERALGILSYNKYFHFVEEVYLVPNSINTEDHLVTDVTIFVLINAKEKFREAMFSIHSEDFYGDDDTFLDYPEVSVTVIDYSKKDTLAENKILLSYKE